MKDSDLWKDTESDDIDKVVERFKERFVEFFSERLRTMELFLSLFF